MKKIKKREEKKKELSKKNKKNIIEGKQSSMEHMSEQQLL